MTATPSDHPNLKKDVSPTLHPCATPRSRGRSARHRLPLRPPFSTREAYRALSSGWPVDVSASTTWALRLPSKLKIFPYLADIDRLSTRANLFYKNCAPSAVCAGCPVIETGRHIFFDCPPAAAFWRCLRVNVPTDEFSIWDLPPPIRTAIDAWRSAVAALLGSLWKARNDRVFNDTDTPCSAVIRRACDDLTLWRWRFNEEDRPPLDALCSFFLSCIV